MVRKRAKCNLQRLGLKKGVEMSLNYRGLGVDFEDVLFIRLLNLYAIKELLCLKEPLNKFLKRWLLPLHESYDTEQNEDDWKVDHYIVSNMDKALRIFNTRKRAFNKDEFSNTLWKIKRDITDNIYRTN